VHGLVPCTEWGRLLSLGRHDYGPNGLLRELTVSYLKVVGQERKTLEHAQIPHFLTLLLRGLVSGETYVILHP